MTTKTTKPANHREPLSETEALRIDLELTRQHLADTVQELSRQLNVPRRLKESAGQAGRRIQATAGSLGTEAKAMPAKMKDMPGRMQDVPGRMKDMPAASRRHPMTTAAVGGAVVLGVGAAAWMVKRHK